MSSGIPSQPTRLPLLDADSDARSTRRALLAASLLALLPATLRSTATRAGQINPTETTITLPDAIQWSNWSGGPQHSGEVATLYGGLNTPGPYFVLIEMESRLYERSAFLRHRSALAGSVRHMVGE